MDNPLRSERSAALGLLAARVPLGVLFVIAGCNALVHTGFQRFAAANLEHVPGWVSRDLGRYYLLTLPFAAVLVGLLLVLGLLGRVAGLLASLILLGLILALGTWKHAGLPHPNLLFLGVALMVLLTGPGPMSLDKTFFGSKVGGGKSGR